MCTSFCLCDVISKKYHPVPLFFLFLFVSESKLTLRFLMSQHKSNKYLVALTFVSKATLSFSSNLTVAAEWNTMFTSSCSVRL